MIIYVLLGSLIVDSKGTETVKVLGAFDHYPTSHETVTVALTYKIQTDVEFNSYRVEEMPLLKGVA